MRRLFLSDCEPGDSIDDVFVVAGKQFSATQGGKPFIKAFISDRTAQLTARMWNAGREIFSSIPESGFARIRGHVENYQNNLQFIIEAVSAPKEGTFDIADLVPHTTRDIQQMCARLHELLGSIQNRHLAALLQAYQDDADLMTNFCKAPAAMSMHHAFIGGLLEHTVNSIEVANAVCGFYPGLNRDLVFAGIFLHDIAKTWELTYDGCFGYSDAGQLVGHIVKSAIWVEQKRATAEQMLGEPIPQQLIDVLQHIILSHHGALDRGFGSARTPATPEAIAVHLIDELDAKLIPALFVTRGDGAEKVEGNWTEYMKSFSGRLYRPDPAPSDPAPAEDTPEPPTSKPPTSADSPPVLQNPLFEINHSARK